MLAGAQRRALEAVLTEKTGTFLAPPERVPQEPLPTGNPEADLLVGGIPRGCITEIAGVASSGRTSLVTSFLSRSTRNEEFAAYIDVTDSFDPATMQAAGVDLDRLLWIRCGGRLEHALRAADLVLHGGGFGITVFDMADVAPEWARRIPMSYWFRFRRAVENKPHGCVLLDPVPCAGTCAALALETRQGETVWRGDPRFLLLRGARFKLCRRKPGVGKSVLLNRLR
jgi:hypothetical protein